jgi:outer membrane protein assembly factor BamB
MKNEAIDYPRRLFLPFAFIISIIGATAEDWPMFGRDKTRNAVSPEKNPPIEWDIKTGKNIKWKAKVGSLAFGTPVVANGFVWIGTNNDNPREPDVAGPAGVLMCFRESDGEFLYQHVSPQRKGPTFRWPYWGISSSSMAEGDRLFFTTTLAETICMDTGPLHRGQAKPRELWKLDMMAELGIFPRAAIMGGAQMCSIGAAYGDLIYVITSNGMTNFFDAEQNLGQSVANPKAPSFVCLNKHTGHVVWEDHSPGTNIIWGEWASPLVMDIAGQAQAIAPQGDGWVRSFDARTGELIWEFDINPKNSQRRQIGKPFPSMTREPNYFSSAPVFYENRILYGLWTIRRRR